MKIIVLVAFLVLSTACHKTISVSGPSQPAPAEQRIYADLITVQTALEGLTAQSAQFPAIKPQLNQAITSYNVTEQSFTAYETAKKANLSNPADLVQIQAMILNLQSSITALGNSFKGAN